MPGSADPAATRHDRTVDFDHTSPEFAAAAESINRDLRERCPVVFSEHHGGFWMVAGYESFARAMRDETTFSSRHGTDPTDGTEFGGVNIPDVPYQNALIEMDPPEWSGLRRLLNPLFAPPAVERMKPELLAFTTVCLDRRIESGSIDFVLDLANPVPAMATLAFLGLPLEEWERYAEPADEVVYTRPGTPEFAKAVDGQAWMFEELARQVAIRRAEPRDDNLSYMVHTEVDGHLLPDEVIVSLCSTIINGGVDTTTSLLSNAVAHLDLDRGLRRQLIDDPSMIPAAAEEFLRYFSPVQSFARTVARDTELDGAHLERGDRVLMCFASVNRDESEFPDADEFVADRFPNRHVAFGLGKHRCIGSTLARVEFVTMLEQILLRIPDYEIDHAEAERYPSIGIVNGYVRMPGRFTPGARIG